MEKYGIIITKSSLRWRQSAVLDATELKVEGRETAIRFAKSTLLMTSEDPFQ